jgi:hypothetical protein
MRSRKTPRFSMGLPFSKAGYTRGIRGSGDKEPSVCHVDLRGPGPSGECLINMTRAGPELTQRPQLGS